MTNNVLDELSSLLPSGTLFDLTLGDVSATEAGASGSLSAVQQLASAIGAAAMTTVYFDVLRSSGQARAVELSLLLVGVVTALCCGLVWLLPRAAQAEEVEPADVACEASRSAAT